MLANLWRSIRRFYGDKSAFLGPREAAYAAADVIESNPKLYDFMEIEVPSGDRSGCILGHIGRQMGYGPGTHINKVAHHLGYADHLHFYEILDAVFAKEGKVERSWRSSDEAAVKVMRKWADAIQG